MRDRMKQDWDERARRDARWAIATATAPEAFDASGQRDVTLFFEGLEHLLTPRARVLDIGCGIGRMDRHVAPFVERLVGLDVSGEMVVQARKRCADLTNLTFVEGSGDDLAPLPDASFDVVFSHIVLQHVPRSVASSYFPEVRRVLVEGGSFVFQMPEANATTPPDPPEEDTFEMRFHAERALIEELEPLGFRHVSSLRHPVVSPAARFDQLRLHFLAV